MASESATRMVGKLEPFLLISKSAKGAAAAKLIQDATSAPGVFLFSELLELPNIQELAKGDHAQHLALLQLFAYKTYPDYLRQKGTMPSLNPAQVVKLKHLTLSSLALERRILPYSLLLQTLQMSNIRELEDLIIDAIYLDIVRGKLDQKEQQFEVEYAMGRDLEPGKIDTLLIALQNWSQTTASVLSILDEKLSILASQKIAEKEHLEQHEQRYQDVLKEVAEKLKEQKTNKKQQGGSLGPMLGDRMDIDEGHLGFGDGQRTKGRNRISQDNSFKQPRKRNRF